MYISLYSEILYHINDSRVFGSTIYLFHRTHRKGGFGSCPFLPACLLTTMQAGASDSFVVMQG
jgi:hypothetical protein